ncbi:MAG: right-handed parallel beta-helix repeat-containing protein [Verrucomicrobiota bacterium]
MRVRILALLLTLLSLGPVRSLAETVLRVNPDAEDSDAPLRRALEEARRRRPTEPGLVIELGAGRYELGQPLDLGTADSGLLLRAAPGEHPVISGGTRIRGFAPSPNRKDEWVATLPQVRDGRWYFRQLFVNGQRAERARTPNTGFFQTARRLGKDSPIELSFRAGDLHSEWAGDHDARLVLLMKWTDLHLPILSVTPGVGTNPGTARLPGGPVPAWMDEPDARYWVENVPDALDAPGEWYLDRKSGTLRYLAPPGTNPNDAVILAPRLTELVRIHGDDSAHPVRDLKIEGITFSDTDYEMPDAGLISPQAAVPIPGTIRIRHAVLGSLSENVFENLGGYALELGAGAQHWNVIGNTIRSVGGGGIRVGEPGGRDAGAADANHSHRITDNRLQSLGRIFAPAVGILVFHSGTNRIAHNHISDLYYTGISVGWNWGYQETPCRENLVEFNLVENVGQDRLSDMGGIYTLGPQAGTVIRNNVFRDISSHGYGGWGLYTDEGSTGILLENNVVYRCKSAGFHQHYGRENLVRNNLIAFNREHELMRTRSEEHRSFRFEHNVVIWDSGDLLGSNWKGTTHEFLLDHNTYFDSRIGTHPAEYRFAGKSWNEWRQAGQDSHSQIADPLLVDPAQPELGLRPNSPALSVGFVPIDLTGLGPRPREARHD